ncbi:VanZ family protein [Blastococcus mobilis]|uniref:VanZ like family protein n=1 Tax=Blastococcus mobilis TaxID=1938746 RepID=A0A238UPL2_9ACTN|nr:VanZ family protein [Blastococcus mobilis]SNR23587.1 VanZ like family protein [Blastococcus mobilis]
MRPTRRVLDAGLASALAGVALVTLVPTGGGWSWAAPVSELQWYAAALGSGPAMLQLFGNLVLLAPLAALAVLRWPPLSAPGRLVAASVAAGAAVELLQWSLPLGRVVSPVDALLNAAGAVLTGLVVARLAAPEGRRARHRCPGPTGAGSSFSPW